MTTVLVIEDEAIIRKNILNILRFEKFETLSAESGAVGVALAREHHPDLIICDVVMPGLDGYAVLQALRHDETTRDIPFIFLTAKTERADLRQGMSLGADDYLTKPFTNAELMEAVRSRLARLTGLREQERHELESAKQKLMQVVAHELRTPLISISTVQELIAYRWDKLSKDEIGELLDTMGSGTRRLARLIEQIVLMTQMDAQVLTAQKIQEKGLPQPAHDLLQGSLSLAQRFSLREKPIVIHHHLGPENPNVRCDPFSLKHAIAELIVNAINYSGPEGEIWLSSVAEQSMVQLIIRDNGAGMSPAMVQHALQPFQQIDRERHEQQGIGMGLPLAQRILAMHAGMLTIRSAPEQGTTVAVSLPIWEPSTPA
ncbi:MAG: response regulator [Anaerolineales bacterium]